jgi:GNAT superfamily N-acetyltransferase
VPRSVEHRRDGFLVTSDPARIDVTAAHAFLTRCYWAQGIPLQTVARSLRHSLAFALLETAGGRQVGLARIISDYATYAYLCDVYVLEEYRGQGLARWLMQCVLAHPDLQGLRRWSLVTRDAHPLYRGLGFADVANPASYMEVVHRDLYTRQPTPQTTDAKAPEEE